MNGSCKFLCHSKLVEQSFKLSAILNLLNGPFKFSAILNLLNGPFKFE